MMNIIVEKKGLFYKSYANVVIDDFQTERLKFTRVTFSREKMVDLIAKKIYDLYGDYKGLIYNEYIQIHTNIDDGFRYDLLFKLRNDYNIDLQKGA